MAANVCSEQDHMASHHRSSCLMWLKLVLSSPQTLPKTIGVGEASVLLQGLGEPEARSARSELAKPASASRRFAIEDPGRS